MASTINTSLSIDIKPFLEALEKTKKATKKAREDVQKQLGDLKITLPTGEVNKLAKQVEKAGKLAATESAKQGKKAGQAYSSSFNDITKTALGVGIGVLLAKGFTGAIGLVRQATTEFIELDTAVNNIGTLGVEDYRNFVDIAIDSSKDLLDTSAVVAQGIYQAYSAGMKGSQEEVAAFVGIASKAAVAGLTDTESAVNGMTSVINAYGLSIDDAQTVSDTFFAGIKLGKTTFVEMNSALASFVPTASALGVGFDQATAAISTLTAMGTPTAIAGTQMNAVFTLLAKGTKPLRDALANAGTDLTTLRDKLKLPVADGGGLVNVMRELKLAADKSGVQIEALTGRVEAAKIIRSLAGDTDKYTKSLQAYANVSAEIEAGAGTKAFEVASESVAVQFAGLKNTLIGVFQKIFAALLPTIVKITQAFVGIFDSPLIQTGLKVFTAGMVFLGDNIKKIAIIAGIFALALTTMAFQAGIAAVNTWALASATVAQSGATGAAAVAQALLNAVMNLNPALLIAAGIAVLVGVIWGLVDAMSVSLEEQEKSLQAQKKAIQGDIAEQKEGIKLAQSKLKVIAAYNDTAKAQDGSAKSQENYTISLSKLKSAYPEIIDLSKSYDENVEALDKHLNANGDTVGRLSNKNKVLTDRYEELSKKTELSTDETIELKRVSGELDRIYPGVISKTTSLGDQMKILSGKTDLATDSLRRQLKTLAESETTDLKVDINLIENAKDKIEAQLKKDLGGTWGKSRGRRVFLNLTPEIDAAQTYTQLEQLGTAYNKTLLDLAASGAGKRAKITQDEYGTLVAAGRAYIAEQKNILSKRGKLDIDAGKSYQETVINGYKELDKAATDLGIETSLSLDEAVLTKSAAVLRATVDTMLKNYGKLLQGGEIQQAAYDDYVSSLLKTRDAELLVLGGKVPDKNTNGLKTAAKTAEDLAKTAEQLAIEDYKRDQKLIKLKATSLELNKENARLTAGEAKDKDYNLSIEKRKLQSLQKQFAELTKLTEKYKVLYNADTGEVVSVGAKITPETRAFIESQLITLLANIKKSEISTLKINTVIDTKDYTEKIKALEAETIILKSKIEFQTEIKGAAGNEEEIKKIEAKYADLRLKAQDKLLAALAIKRADAQGKLDGDLTDKQRVQAQKEYNTVLEQTEKILADKRKLQEEDGEKQVSMADQLLLAVGNVMKSQLANTVAAVIAGQQEAGKAIVMIGLDVLQAMIPVWIASIYGKEFMDKGLGGFVTATIMLGVLTGLVLAAKSAAGGYEKGGYTGDGNVKSEAGVVHKREFVFSAPMVSKIGKDKLEQLHKTGSIDGFIDNNLQRPQFANNQGVLSEKKTQSLLVDIAERVTRVEHATGAGFDRRNKVGITGKFKLAGNDLTAAIAKNQKKGL